MSAMHPRIDEIGESVAEEQEQQQQQQTKKKKKKKKTKKTYYEQTSQNRHWRFSAEQLRELRHATNAAAVDRVRHSLGEENKRRLEEHPTAATVGVSNVQYLTPHDELTLCSFYEAKAMEFCNHFKYPVQVKATAVTYMKRFFLYNSAMDYPPKNVMITCLFLATKTENHFINAEKFAERIPKTTKAMVVELEFTISQALRFEFATYHPYRALYGLWLDMQTHIAPPDLHVVHKSGQKHVDTSLFTDACLMFSPSQIAWACMRRACDDHGKGKEFRLFLATRLREASASALLESVMDRIDELLRSFVKPSLEKVKEVDRRLILCRNPERNPASLIHKRKKEQEERDHEERRQKKLKEVAERSKEQDSTFGIPLPINRNQ